ncbi:MAG: Gfo/Idh/MocA family oxidoreductase [Pedosphaera sp.]|nr:Gfo/Idh/MocA family oxidoreductase [Pedosphaera sp.]MST00980.1 Gfo/Idh/MocA family oxidoreductase [Pedosphaera sp.]
MNQNTSSNPSFSRRDFLTTTTKAAAGASLLGALSAERFALGASPSDTVKIALIGCGGRGSGAANQALGTDGSVKLVAAADVHPDRLNGAISNLSKAHKDKVDIKKENLFLGFDGYKKAIAMADVVILATPPGFRPMQFEEAVRQGKHVFMEKPVCVDAPGFRKVMAAAQEAKKKNLKVGVGLQRHHQLGYLETMKRLHDGAIGDIVAMRAYWNGNTPWVRRRDELEKQYGRKLTEMEYQLRNWYYFVWLCGDHIAEQHIHNLDVINWVKKGPPVSARGNGGCETRKGKDYGEIFDHHVVEFTYADGSVCFSQCRHQQGCWNDVSESVIGTKGKSDLGRYTITGENAWRFKGGGKDAYQQEHDDLFAAIRNDTPFNEAEYGAASSMTSVLGRMATYSGKEVTWEQAINSQVDTMVPNIDKVSFEEAMNLSPKSLPDPATGLYKLAIPGVTTVI